MKDVSEIIIKKDDVLKYEFSDILHGKELTYHEYYLKFKDEAENSKKNNNKEKEELFILFIHIASLVLKPEDLNNPLKPMFVLENGRSTIVEDFSEEQLNNFEEIIPEIDNDSIKARLADIIWLRIKNYKYGKTASKSYLNSAKKLIDERIHEDRIHYNTVDRIKRAIDLEALLGKNTQDFNNIIKEIENSIDRFKDINKCRIAKDLIDILIKYKSGNSKKHLKILEECIEPYIESRNWDWARSFWETINDLYIIEKNDDKNKEILEEIAKSYVEQAQDSVNIEGRGYLIGAHYLENAIVAYRRIGGKSDEVEKLHMKLIDYQEKSRSEISTINTDLNVTKQKEAAIDAVKGKSFEEAVFTLSTLLFPKDIKKIEIEVKESMKNFPMQYLIPSVLLNESGKVTGRRNGLLSGKDTDDNTAFEAEMLNHARKLRNLNVICFIEPARIQINNEHSIDIKKILPFVSNNPFIPQNREYIYARGIIEGFNGELMNAIHILIPQIENSLRYILYQHNEITSKFDEDGIQDEYLLGRLLDMPKTKEILGENLIFDLKGLLTERFGDNLRNRIAHGLVSYSNMYASNSLYMWWLTLHLICIPKYNDYISKNSSNN